ncbi:MAG: hypothetical protein K2O10_06205, partial [Muribaculaceae bacterium]|nr:hypothetical protein [Muribaculaceae bacterium]
MGQIFAYSLTSSILLAAMYLVYKWILSSENYHRINRAVLLLIYVVAICIPVVMPAVSDSVNTQLVRGAVEIGPLAAIDSGQQPAGEVPAHTWLRWVVWLYLAGIGVVLLLTAINLKTLLGIIVNGDKVVISGRKVVVTDSVRYAPFSFGSAIVMSRQDYANGAEMILRHESGHVELHHWA